MGCFDSVLVPCPDCGCKVEFQSKSGPCALEEYELGEAPAEVLIDINRHSPHVCPDCSCKFMVAPPIRVVKVLS